MGVFTNAQRGAPGPEGDVTPEAQAAQAAAEAARDFVTTYFRVAPGGAFSGVDDRGYSFWSIDRQLIRHPDMDAVRANAASAFSRSAVTGYISPGTKSWIVNEAGFAIAPLTGDVAPPTDLSALIARLAALERKAEGVQVTVPRAATPWSADYNHILQVGESRSQGAQNNEVIQATAVPGMVMFDTGGLDAGGGSAYPAANAAFGGLVPLAEELHGSGGDDGETGIAAQGQAAIAAALSAVPSVGMVASGRQFLGSTAGFDGHTMAQLFDSAEIIRLNQQISWGKARATALGKTYAPAWINLVTGENDYIANTDRETFKSLIRLYHATIVEGFRTATGNPNVRVPMMMPVLCSHQRRGKSSPYLATALLELADENPDFIATMPNYICDFVDAVHEDAASTRIRDAYSGEAAFWWEVLGRKWQPLRRVEHRVTGNVVATRWGGACGPIAFRTDRVTDPGDYGVVIRDLSGTALDITMALDPNSNDTTLATVAGGEAETIEYAWLNGTGTGNGRATGPRGCIADSYGASRSVDLGSHGTFALHKHAMPFKDRLEV